MGKFLQNDSTTKQKEIRQLAKDNYSDVAFSFSTKSADFVFIDAVSAYRDYLVAPAQGVIIRDIDFNETLDVLRKIRRSQRPEIYLLPIYLQSGTVFHQLAPHVDGAYDPGKIQQIREQSEEINQIAATFTSQLPQSDEKARIWVKTAQFLRSRKMKTLAPIPTRTSNIGYTYPFVGTLFHANDQIKLLQYLENSLDFGIFEGRIVDKVNLCKDCQGSYLNFRDVCPNCQGIDLRSEPIIHHFRCAHVAPESDFVQGYDLVCPKCDKALRHIGIDYDKPSEVVCCNTCNHTTQDPIMEASCVDCGSTTSLDRIVSKPIYHFDLTIKGEGIAQQEFLGVDTPKEVLPKGILEIKDFELMAAQEFRRMSIKGHPSYLLQVKIPPEQFDFLPPHDFRQLCIECTQILQQYFRPLDLFSLGADHSIWVLLSETSEDTAEYMLNLSANNLQKLLIDNFDLAEVQLLADYCLLKAQLPQLL